MHQKLYIFLTFAICGIGGTQIYVRNKVKYLQKKGWDTCVISTEPPSEIIINELEQYREGIFCELVHNPYLYSTKQRNRIINRIIQYIETTNANASDIIIESNYIAVTPWAEILAEILKAKHFIFFIQEDYHFKIDSYRKFFEFKLDRGELAANTHNAVKTLFDNFRTITNSTIYQLPAHCSNSIEDCNPKISNNLPPADFYIGSFGRINKPFVLPMIDRLSSYVAEHPDKKFHLVLFGWSDNPDHYEYITKKIKAIPNLSFQITGPIYPVSRSDLKKMNVFISTAGAAWATYMEKILTISVDDNDLFPIGVLGHTTTNTIHRADEPKLDLGLLLDGIFFDHKYENYQVEPPHFPKDEDHLFDSHFEFISQGESTLKYYPISVLNPKFKSRLYFRLKNLFR